ncbi:MAG: hypothetical protein ABWJ99_08505 [Caldimicrobium sp.]
MKKFLNLKTLKVKKDLPLTELFIMIFMLFLAYIFHEKPEPPEKVAKSTLFSVKKPEQTVFINATSKATFQEKKDYAEKEDREKIQSLFKKPGGYKNLARRNPFTPEGSYAGLIFPENPYILIATKFDGQPQALLRLFTGEIITVKEGDKLLDGARVEKIKEKTVIIKRLNKKIKLQIFNIEVEKWKPKKSF